MNKERNAGMYLGHFRASRDSHGSTVPSPLRFFEKEMFRRYVLLGEIAIKFVMDSMINEHRGRSLVGGSPTLPLD